MRIGLVIYGSLETISGGYLYDRELVAHLRACGDSVEIIARPWRNYAQHLSDNASPHFYRQLRDARVDVLIQDELNHPSLFGLNARLRRTARFPLVSLVHHLRCYEAHPALLNALYRRIERRYLATITHFICNSETTRQAINDTLKQNVQARSLVAYPAGDRFNPQITSAQIERRAHEPGPLRIVFVGNLIARKGLHTLLAALAHLPADSWQLTVVGNTQMDARYAQLIRRQIAQQSLANVRFVGVLSDAALAATLLQAQVMAVPSQYEGFGIVYLEGMSFGLPALASHGGAAKEIVTDGENGYLVAPDAVQALSTHLRALHQQRAQLAQMSLAARARFLAQPRWQESMSSIRAQLQAWVL